MMIMDTGNILRIGDVSDNGQEGQIVVVPLDCVLSQSLC